MPDLAALLRKHLSYASVPPEVEEELVSHLTDLYDAELARGLDGERALDVARDHLGDPIQLLRAVRQYKGGFMASFRRYILVPGLFATALTTLAGNMLAVYRLNRLLLTKDFFSRDTYWWSIANNPHMSQIIIDLPLLLAYLFAGSFAALLCMQFGGNRRQRIWASLVPAAVPLSLSCWDLVKMWGEFDATHHVIVFFLSVLPSVLLGPLISWTILPAAALLIGAAPFLTRRTEQPVGPVAHL